jgi:hypothetical protein
MSIAAIAGHGLAAIRGGMARASGAADTLARADSLDDRLTLSGDGPPDRVGALVDLRVARYQVAAGASVLRSYDELAEAWSEVGEH